jgi:pimeloyl-ACP methyl ester carboxylesterase
VSWKIESEREMVNIFAIYKPLLGGVMRVAGVRPQMVEIEPGTVVHFWVGNEAKKKPKPAVVFLHGFGEDGIAIWQFQVLALARKYRVFVPDLLFFGRSLTDKSERSPEFQAECMAKGLRKLGVESCTLVGLSYGGTVGFKMAKMYPDLVESLVVTCSVMALTESLSGAALERIGFKSWPEYLLPDSGKGVELLFDVLTYKLPLSLIFFTNTVWRYIALIIKEVNLII